MTEGFIIRLPLGPIRIVFFFLALRCQYSLTSLFILQRQFTFLFNGNQKKMDSKLKII